VRLKIVTFTDMRWLFFILMTVTGSRYRAQVVDSLEALLQNKQLADSTRIKLYGDISWELIGNNINKSLDFATRELTLSIKAQRKADEAQAESDLGNIYNRKAAYDTALVHYQKALALRKALGHEEKMAGIYANIATVYMRQSKFSQALELEFNSLKLFEKLGRTANQANLLGNIGNIYNELGQYASAMEFFRKGFAISEKYPLIRGNIRVNMGGLKFTQSMRDSVVVDQTALDSAIYFYLDAENYLKKVNADYNLAAVYNDLGRIYTSNKQYALAITYSNLSLDIRRRLSDRLGVGLSLLAIGDLYYKTGRTQEALQQLEESASILEDLQQYYSLKDALIKLSNIYQAKGDYKKALQYFAHYAATSEKLYSNENAAKMAEMKTLYETEKKDLELLKTRAELDRQHQKILIRNITIGAVIVVLLFIVMTGYFYIRKRSLQQKAELDAELARQNAIRAKAVIEAEEHQRMRIARDLHDGIGQLLSAARLNIGSMQRNEDNATAMTNALSLLDDSIKEVRSVSHEMMPGTLMKQGLESALREFMGKLQGLKTELTVVGITERLPTEKEMIVYRAIQELVTNTIRHAQAKRLSVQVIQHDKELTVMVEDDGKGYDTTTIHQAAGIGLKNIVSRIEFAGGAIYFDSSLGKGSTTTVEIPV